jgi:hypothetical protein
MPIDIPDNVDRTTAASYNTCRQHLGLSGDPVTWLLLISCIAFWALRWRPYAPLIAALAASFTIYSVFSWWTKLGIADQWITRGLWIFLVDLVIAYVAYGAARLIGAAFPRPHGRAGGS